MRTLVVSDLHLGARRGGDVLRSEGPRAALLEAARGVRRLLLLGDVIELRQGPAREALAAAGPVLEELGHALGPEAEVLIVPGNHDHGLLRPWQARRALDAPASALALETDVDWRYGEPLALVAERLAPARVRAAYPGVWLREDVYAIHGHYGDLHTTVPMFERLAAGMMARIVGERGEGRGAVEDYEAVLAPMYAWIDALAERDRAPTGRGSPGPSTQAWHVLNGSSGARRRRLALRAAVPLAIGALGRAGLGPLNADVSGPELRRASLIAFARAITRLDVHARHVIFGHTHRAGPLPGDDRGEWVTGAGVRLLNTGCWVHERAFLGSAPKSSPYRAGFAAVVGDTADPELVNLLDGLTVPRRA